MYLYEKEDSKIKVYEMKQDTDTFREYRKKEMEKIPKGKEYYVQQLII